MHILLHLTACVGRLIPQYGSNNKSRWDTRATDFKIIPSCNKIIPSTITTIILTNYFVIVWGIIVL